jgi:hypothetical protein
MDNINHATDGQGIWTALRAHYESFLNNQKEEECKIILNISQVTHNDLQNYEEPMLESKKV